LLVDDSEPFLRAAQIFLSQSAEVRVVGLAHDGCEALALAANLRPDIILLDLNMTGMSGLSALAPLREAFPQLGLIALTQYELDAYREAALAAGADAFVAKRLMWRDVLPAIRTVYKQRQTASLHSEPGIAGEGHG
jgi:DNA-binding NarL/FixJ family response regulator